MSIPTAVDGVTPVDAALLNAYKSGIEACEPALGLPASSGYLLSSDDEGGRSWVPAPSSSPTTAEGDLIVRGAAEDEALPVGDEGQVLAVSSGVPAWVTLPVPVLPSVCDARLTLTQGVPVTTSDVIGASTIYLTRYRGAHVALWDGLAWVLHEVPSGDVSLALSGLTAGKVYDVFLHDAAGTLTLSLSAAWADNTTRTDALAYQDGVRVLASDHTRRLVGTFVATGTDTTEDSGGTEDSSKQRRYLCNERHRVPKRATTKFPWTVGYTYYSNVWRVAGNTSSVYISALCGGGLPVGGCIGGIQEDGRWWVLGLGLDGATTPDAAQYVPCFGYARGMVTAPLTYSVSEGLHEFRVLEKSSNDGELIKAPTTWLDLVFQV